MADWVYKGQSYYSSLRLRLNAFRRSMEAEKDISEADAISLYQALPDIPFDLRIAEDGSNIVPDYLRPVNIQKEISEITFPTIPEDEFRKILEYEPKLEGYSNYFDIAGSLPADVPVNIIFDKTFSIVSSDEYINLKLNNASNVNYNTIVNYLFDFRLWPDLPDRSPVTYPSVVEQYYIDRIERRRKEFYSMISKKDPDEIQRYILFVMMYYDGVPVVTFNKDNEVEDSLRPYKGDNLDNWQKAWNNTIPIICDFVSFTDLPDGCDQHQPDRDFE